MSYLLKYSLPPLTQEQERALLQKAHEGNDESDSAVETLLRSNIKLLYKLAREFLPCNLTADDLASEGASGLVHAISKFDLDQDVRFITYACWWVRQKMRIAISNQNNTVRVPAKANVQRARLLHQKDELQEILGHEPTTQELSEYLEMPEYQVRQLLYSLGYDTRITATEEDPQNIEDILGDLPMEGFLEETERREQKEKLEKAWRRLSKRDKYILTLRFGLDRGQPRTLEQVAQEVGRCKERVRQLQDEALANLKQKIQ